MPIAATDVAPRASPLPKGWHRPALTTLPADVRARLSQIDADNTARMQAPAQPLAVGEAPTAAAVGPPVAELVDEVFIKVLPVVSLRSPCVCARR